MSWNTLWHSIPSTIPRSRLSGTCWRTLMVGLMLGFSLAAWPAQAQLFREVVVLGDSLSDIGNVLVITRPTLHPIPDSPPYASGRFSNGPVWVEQLAQRFGLNLSPSLEGGLDFAFGGAEIDVDKRDVLEFDIGVTVSSLLTQEDIFQASQFFDKVDAATLYVVWGGANDLRDALRTEPDPFAEARGAASALGRIIRQLADEGAVYFLVPNLPDLGRTPELSARGPQAVAQATEVSMAFNQALGMTLDGIEAERQVHIARLDTFAQLEEIIANPAVFGLTNVTEACLVGDYVNGGTPCATPATYLFWDQLHPTAAAHALLAQFAADVLPPLVVIAGPNNTDETPQVNVPTQNLSVLQARVRLGDEAMRLTSVTLEFTNPMEQATRVQNLQVHLSQDTNANGRFDAGEPVLATGQLPGAMGSLSLLLPTPCTFSAATTVDLVVSLDINSSALAGSLQSATLGPGTTPQGAPLESLALLLPVLGLLVTLRLHGSARALGGLIVCSALLLSSCDAGKDAVNNLINGNDTSRNAFTVVMPAQGSSAQGDISGLVTFPPATITGATVRINP